MSDPVSALRRLGRGTTPRSLDLEYTREGRVDLRGLRFPRAQAEGEVDTALGRFSFGKVVKLKSVQLERVDLAGASISNSVWEKAGFKDVVLSRADVREVAFGSGKMEGVSFQEADLRGASWGFEGRAGPVLTDCDFSGADMRQTAYAHPYFRRCQFIQARLDEVDFRGARFEDCVFAGRLSDVWFRERFRDSNPLVARLRNPMKNVDFSMAELEFVSFLDLDLTSCKLPEEGHMKVPRPRAVFQRALRIVETEWSGRARGQASDYLRKMLQFQIRKDIPLHIFRPSDLEASPLGREVATGLVREIARAAKELDLAF